MRQVLAKHRGLFLTQDTINALKSFERRAWEGGEWRAEYLELDTSRPLAKAGREVLVRLTHDRATPERSLAATWAFIVPSGFTPWNRYPVQGEHDLMFHYLGPWGPLHDRLCAEGRGHMAWDSVCKASLLSVGEWDGDRKVETQVQAHLHRIGMNCGPLDGVLGPRTLTCIEALGLTNTAIDQVLEHLEEAEPPKPQPRERGKGYVSVPGWKATAVAFGGIEAVRNSEAGFTLRVTAPGRLIVDVGVPS